MAKYVPYCSVEIKFGSKEDLRAIVNDCGPDKKVLVVIDSIDGDSNVTTYVKRSALRFDEEVF